MTSLLDLGPMTKTVEITNPDGKKIPIEVNPISAEVIFELLWRFETFRKLMEGKIDDLKPVDIMRKMAPDALSAVIVACTGGVPEPDEKRIAATGEKDQDKARLAAKSKMRAEAETIARRLGADDQLTILAEAFKMTFRDGVGPFVTRLRSLITSVDVTTLEQLTSLPEELSAALVMDVHLPRRGKVPPVKSSATLN